MPEKLWEILFKLADVCHWFGKYNESNAVMAISRLAKSLGLDDVAKLEKFVGDCEKSEGAIMRARQIEEMGETVYRCPVEGCRHWVTINGNLVYHLAKSHGIQHDGTGIR